MDLCLITNKRKHTFDTSGFSCQNTDCQMYHKVNEGTIFFRRKKSKETITRVLQNTVEGCGIRATGRVFGDQKLLDQF